MLSMAEVESSAGTYMDLRARAGDEGSSNNVEYEFGETPTSPNSVTGLKWELTAYQFIGHNWAC
jgi:hypothetical protein